MLTVANAATFAQALGLVRDGGTILIFGAKPGDSPFATELWELYRREITVISSYSPAPADLHEADVEAGGVPERAPVIAFEEETARVLVHARLEEQHLRDLALQYLHGSRRSVSTRRRYSP